MTAPSMTDEQLFDVVAVKIRPPNTERVIATSLTRDNAEATVKIAVARRGVDDEFFTTRKAMTNARNEAYDSGFRSSRASKEASANPYPAGGELHAAWLKGWNDYDEHDRLKGEATAFMFERPS